MPDEAKTIWTIGHSTRSWPEFADLITAHQIDVLADVRRHAGSRKYPQFNPDDLRDSLAKIGVEYLPMPELGGRRQPRSDSANTVWRNASFQGYADYMETEEFAAGVQRLLEVAATRRVAMMCAEAVWWRCHRALIADYLKIRGHQVCHIMNATRDQPHPYTSAARVVDGELSYAPGDAAAGEGGPES